MYSSMQVTFSGVSGQEMALKFSLRPTSIAQKWAECVVEANRSSRISERQRWFNFPGQPNSPEHYREQILAHVGTIRRKDPALIPEGIENLEFHPFLYHLHALFVRLQAQPPVDPEVAAAVSALNLLIHAYESQERSAETVKMAGISEASLVVPWELNAKRRLYDEDYAGFTVAKKFGTCYLSYCQAGTHIYEMFLEKNTVVPLDQIRPLRHLSADSYFWFGSTTGPKALAKRQNDIATWFRENEPLFRALGFYWGDPRLAIGWLPVADLDPAVLDLADQNALIRKLSSFGSVVSMEPH